MLEGLDRSGKSTQAQFLHDSIPNSKLVKFPDRGTSIGQTINAYLTSSRPSIPNPTESLGERGTSQGGKRSGKTGGEEEEEEEEEGELDDHAIHLLFSANRWEKHRWIKSQIDSGTTLILDRYVLSGQIYSLSKGLPSVFCRGSDVGLPRPDLTLFLDLGVEVSMARGGFGEERYEREEVQRRVRTLFLSHIASENSSELGDGKQNAEGERRGEERGRIVVVNADKTVEELRREIRGVVEDRLLCRGDPGPLLTIT